MQDFYLLIKNTYLHFLKIIILYIFFVILLKYFNNIS